VGGMRKVRSKGELARNGRGGGRKYGRGRVVKETG